MMNFKRRLLSLALVLLLILSTAAFFSGCTMSRSGPMRKIEGTYQLTSYSTNKNDLEERGMILYVVIRADGTGYYAYRDNENEGSRGDVRCRFTQDPEKSGYYEYVEINFTGENDGYKKLGIYSKLFDKNLNSNQPKYGGSILDGTYGIKYYVYVVFERVSRKTDLSYIEKALGKAEIRPYGASLQ